MRRVFLITGLMTAFALAVLAVTAAAPANFAGTWALDKTKSQGLSQRMQNADSVVWTITQDGKTISIDSKVTGGQPPAGGGGGMGGGRGPAGPQVYNLDGSETSADVGGGQMTGKATSKTTWSKDGATLELSRKTTFQGPNGEVTNSSTQKLSLSGDGKVLTATVHSEGARGAQDSTLVFNKQ
ncbi:MAG TPA: hypothetical protein VHD88_08010 [Pyrinomonadaceae bacterium]|nr:hypothetical protein [Pyrinomonadaceae bacterium]